MRFLLAILFCLPLCSYAQIKVEEVQLKSGKTQYYMITVFGSTKTSVQPNRNKRLQSCINQYQLQNQPTLKLPVHEVRELRQQERLARG